MCGRVGFFDDTGWKRALDQQGIAYTDLVGELHPSYNVAPSQPMATLLNNHDYTYTRFGLIPHWAKDAKFQPINARAETIAQKPTFKSAIAKRRCLIPVNGFYEWMKTESGKVPFWITPEKGGFFALAGVYDEWLDPATGDTVRGSAIITTDANRAMKPIHDRMPVIIEPKEWKLWLDPDVDEPEAVQPLLVPYGGVMHTKEVSTYVNSPVHNDEKCINEK
jgi:putative SOS response-associated peptidase YedK